MEVKTSLFGDESLEKLNRLIVDYYFSLATNAASKGKYNLASNYLAELLQSSGESILVFDLQAKMAAQQGKFKEAEFLWKKCLKIEPDNQKYLGAISRLNKLQGLKVNRFAFLLKLSNILLFILLFFIIIYLYSYYKQDKIERENNFAQLINMHEVMVKRMDSIMSPVQTINEVISKIGSKAKSIEVISVHENDSELTITFNEGLFSRGINIKSNQLETLRNFSKVLSPFAGKINVYIIGSSDDIPVANNERFQNNEELSLFRAKVVYDIIYEESKIPREDLSIGSLSALNSVYPNDSPENRLKNRTVNINITQK
ncbi:MAG: OmpA family protein [Candidatus Paceibacterota bacterium]